MLRDGFSGAGGGGSTQTGDNLFSTDIVEVVLGVSEGPIKGLVDGAKSFLVGDTALQNVDGDDNFNEFELTIRKGSELGETITPRSGGFGSSTEVNTNLETATAVVRSGLHTDIDYIDVRLVVNRLLRQTDDGTFEHTGKVKLEYKLASSGTWLPVKTKHSDPLPPSYEGDSYDAYYGEGTDRIAKGSPGDRAVTWTNEAPSTTEEGALWFDADDGGRPRYMNGDGDWVEFSGATFASGAWSWSEASSWGADKLTKAYINVTPAPAAREQGDFWLNQSDGVVYFFNGAAWVIAGSTLAPGSFGSSGVTISDGEITIKGKTSSPVVKEFRIPVERTPTGTYDLRITKTSAANTTELFFDISWESFQEISTTPMNFPGLATAHLVARASDQFSSVPDFSGIYEGRLVKVPSNYNPETRVYTGVWDGTWATAYTNNGAYIVNDLVDNDRYGLNAYYPVSLNKWDVYEAGQWCDTLTEDGSPRFTFNALLSEPRGVREAIDYICGTFAARFIDDGNGFATLQLDRDNGAVGLFTADNVVEGVFTYSFTEAQSRHNDITVSFTNPALNWAEDRRRVSDAGHIARYGRVPLDFVAVGCIDVNEAIRRARYKLVTDTTECTIVNFKTNRAGMYLQPFEIVLIADEEVGALATGRVKSVLGARHLQLRDSIYLEPGFSYKLVFQLDEGLEEVELEAGSGAMSDLWTKTDLPTLPEKAVFAIQTVDGLTAPRPFRVTSISEVEDNPDEVEIQGINVNRLKWQYVDGLIDDIDELQQTDLGTGYKTRPVPALRVRPFVTMSGARQINGVTLDWDASPTVTVQKYRILVSKDNAPPALLAETTQLSFEWNDIPPGEYLFSVVAVSASGSESNPVVIEQRFVGDYREPSPVENLRLVNETDPNVFTTPSPTFNWDPVTAPDHSDYVVRILTTANVQLAEYITTGTAFTFERAWNTAVAAGRTFKIAVASRDQFGSLSQFATLTVSNPAPGVADLTIYPSFTASAFHWKTFTIPDYAGAKIWVRTSPGFSPGGYTPDYDGPGSSFTFGTSPLTTYYVRIALYDTFGTDNLVYSSELTFTTGDLVGGINEELAEVPGYLFGDGTGTLYDRFREVDERFEELAALLVDTGATGHVQRLEITAELGTTKATFQDQITVVVDDVSALTDRLTTLESTVADGSVVAGVIADLEALATEVDAQATALTEVSAQVGDVTAGARWAMQAIVAPSGVTARFAMMVRVTDADTYIESGILIDIITVSPGVYTSRIALKTDQLVVTDGVNTANALTFEDGTLKILAARMGRIDSPDGVSYIDLGPAPAIHLESA